jgi:D-alanine-D-alanine ligase
LFSARGWVRLVAERVRVGVFFGSRSVEHEVSVITAQQAMAAMPADRFVPVPVYISSNATRTSTDSSPRQRG